MADQNRKRDKRNIKSNRDVGRQSSEDVDALLASYLDGAEADGNEVSELADELAELLEAAERTSTGPNRPRVTPTPPEVSVEVSERPADDASERREPKRRSSSPRTRKPSPYEGFRPGPPTEDIEELAEALGSERTPSSEFGRAQTGPPTGPFSRGLRTGPNQQSNTPTRALPTVASEAAEEFDRDQTTYRGKRSTPAEENEVLRELADERTVDVLLPSPEPTPGAAPGKPKPRRLEDLEQLDDLEGPDDPDEALRELAEQATVDVVPPGRPPRPSGRRKQPEPEGYRELSAEERTADVLPNNGKPKALMERLAEQPVSFDDEDEGDDLAPEPGRATLPGWAPDEID